MDYKKVLRLHFVNHLSCREIAESCGDCSKTTVNEFLKRFRENPEYSNAIVHAFQKFRAPFSGKIVHIFPEQSAVI